MNTVTTTNRKEAMNNDKIYLNRTFFQSIDTIFNIFQNKNRCKECGNKIGMKNYFHVVGFCDEFCRDNYEIKQPFKELKDKGVCKYCGEMTSVIMTKKKYQTKNGLKVIDVASGVYRKICDDCNKLSTYQRNKKKRETQALAFNLKV